jgi:proline iminopeptidase
MHPLLRLLLISIAFTLGSAMTGSVSAAPAAYFDSSGRDDVLSGGVKMITVQTPKGAFRVWTKRVGNNPAIKVLLLHGGPGATHEYFEAFDSFFPNAGIEYYYYDQLGSAYSDQPDQPALWDLPRFVEEVEQVRKALKLDKTNFYGACADGENSEVGKKGPLSVLSEGQPPCHLRRSTDLHGRPDPVHS